MKFSVLFAGGWLVLASVASPARAETKVVQEVEGKKASLALLKRALEDPTGRFCGAKGSKLVVRVDDEGAVTTTTKDKRDHRRAGSWRKRGRFPATRA